MEEKTYVLLIKENKNSDWEQKGKESTDRYSKEAWAEAAQKKGWIFSAKLFEMPSEWLVFWI